MGSDFDGLELLLAFVSGERMIEIVLRDEPRHEIGSMVFIYGVDAGLRGDDLRLEPCPDELRLQLLDGHDYRGNDTIGILASEPARYPEKPAHSLGILQNRKFRNDPRYKRTGPSHFCKTNNGWKR